jgi:hypothetical protein
VSDQANGRVRRDGRYACAAAILLRNLPRNQPVGGIGDLCEPSGVHANVRIVRFNRSTHVVAAFRRRWAFVLTGVSFCALLALALRNEASR